VISDVRIEKKCRSCSQFPERSTPRAWTYARAALRPQAGAARRRYRIRRGSDAELAGRGEGDRTSYSGERQIKTRGWHLLVPCCIRPGITTRAMHQG